ASGVVHGGPIITIYTDSDTYEEGDTIEVSLSAENLDEAMSVAVYVGLIDPDGDIYTYQIAGWSDRIEPWIPEIWVPCPFTMHRTPYWRLDVPCSMPPIGNDGDYAFAAVLMYPETSDWVCNASLAPFSFDAGPSTDITMLSIPAGSFLMGSPEEEEWHRDDEEPQHTVHISAFLMSETEVTQGQWQEIMGRNLSWFKGDRLPTTYETWFDNVEFCNKLSDAHGLTKCYTITNKQYSTSDHRIISADVSCNFTADGYRLPTEAEWEYACRAGTTSRFNTGDLDSDIFRAGWVSGNANGRPHPVGEKEANAWGLYDMHGNAAEWCWDWYDDDYYEERPNPDIDPLGPSNRSKRVTRGGNFGAIPWFYRCASRDPTSPSNYTGGLGLRLCRSQ
ncbi:MAG: SUMF1/EgtB/PvdO family nonheme iron enzyme, partial [Candidatus Coatesbacteria bacterium]|nr:SUMF1/EgtB/PvdO family nonheme iron enzyme [Candidatus Coatesbacteria bacterium]